MLDVSAVIKPFSRCLQLLFRKIYELLLSIYHFVEHEDSFLGAESCSCYWICSNKELRLTAVPWYFSLLVILFQNRQNIFSVIFRVKVPYLFLFDEFLTYLDKTWQAVMILTL